MPKELFYLAELKSCNNERWKYIPFSSLPPDNFQFKVQNRYFIKFEFYTWHNNWHSEEPQLHGFTSVPFSEAN